MRVIALIAALIAVGLAGCAGDGSSNDTGLSAAAGMESDAKAWHPNAELIYLESFEIRSDSPFAAAGAPTPEVGAAYTAVTREPVGDGRSSMWAGVYEAEGDSVVMFWTPNDVIFQNVTDDVPFGSPIDLSKVLVDSDEAAEKLAAVDSNWTVIQDQTEVFGSVTLISNGDSLYWAFFAAANDTLMTGAVDAITGNVSQDLEVSPESLAGTISGIAANDSGAASFELEHNHDQLIMNFAKGGGEPIIGSPLDVVVTDPAGTTYEFTVTGNNNVQTFDGPQGTWSILVTNNDLLLQASLTYAGYTLE